MSESNFLCVAYLSIRQGLLAFPGEQFLSVVKITAQQNPHLSSIQIIRSISEKSIFGFGNAFLANFYCRLSRDAFKWPLMSVVQNELTTRFPKLFKPRSLTTLAAITACIAVTDSIIALPFTQLVAYRLKENQSYRTFFRTKFKQDGIASLYPGFRIHLIHQSILYIVVLTADAKAKKVFDCMQASKETPYKRQAFASAATGAFATLLTLPAEFIKAHIQINQALQKRPIPYVICNLKARYGLSGFYSGAAVAFTHAFFHSVFRSCILNEINN